MIRNLLLMCAGLLIGLISTYALSGHESPADFTYVNPSDIHTLDPARMSWTQDFRVALNIWEGLTTWHPRTLKPAEGGAEFPPRVAPDGLTYTFTIRDDGRWSNGDTVTAPDFVRGWRRGLEPGTATDYTFLLTDYIVGAADYARWRHEGVALLTALDRLRNGRPVTVEQARAVAGSRIFLPLPVVATGKLPPPPDDADDQVWESFAEGLLTDRVNWPDLHAKAFQKHVDEFDTRFAGVGVEAPDPRTLIARLAKPCPFFLDLLGLPIFLPCHPSVELLREGRRKGPITAQGLVVYDPQWTKPDYHRNGYPGLITNGPYRLVDWRFKRRARLAVNPFYRTAASVGCRTIDMVVYDNINAAIMAYEAGDVDFLPAMDVPYDHEIARLAQSGERPDFHLCPVLGTYFLNFNCLSETVHGRPNPLLDRRVRGALSLAVDKPSIVRNVLSRGDRVAGSLVPPEAIPGYVPPAGVGRDVDTARRLLAEAGYPDGSGLPPIDLLYTPNDERVCQALARMWEQTLGVRIELLSKESKTFAEDKASHRFMIARGNWFGDYNDPTTFLDCLGQGNGNNDSGYSDGEYDALLAEASALRDPEARAALLQRAEAILVERDFPVLPILHYTMPIAIQPHVRGLFPNARLWFPFRYVEVHQ